MHWKMSGAKNAAFDYIGDAEALPLKAAVYELWKKYTEDCAPKNMSVMWDYLRVELWLDSGRIILFPAASASKNRIERSACQITCRELLAAFDKMAVSMPDDQFDSWHAQAVENVVAVLSQAAKQTNLPHQLGRSEVRIRYFSYGGEEAAINEDVLHE